MKLKTIQTLSCAVLACAWTSHAAMIANWTFEGASVSGTGSDKSYGIADSGDYTVGSVASGHHATAGTTWSAPVGNGSAKSFSANTWTDGASGDYWQFAVSTLGYSGIKLSWDQASSNTGPRDYGLYYSTDGALFTQFGSDYIVLANATPNPTWSSGTPHPEFSYTRDLSAVTALDGQAGLIYFRLVDKSTVSANGGAVAVAGSDRIDNFVVSGELASVAVPEPSTLIAGALLGLPFWVHGIRYLRNRKQA